MKSRFLHTLALTALITSVATFSSGTLGVVGNAYAAATIAPSVTALAHAHGLDASVGGLLNLNVESTPQSNCVAPSPANPFPPICAAASNLVTANLEGLLTTGVLNTSALAIAGPEFGLAALALAQASVANPLLSVLGLLNVNANVIRSFAVVQGSCFSQLLHAGSSSLVNGEVTGLLSLLIPPNALNQVVVNVLLGIKVVLNEQILEGDGFSSRKITINPIHITIPNLLGLLSADITVAQSVAGVACPGVVP